MKFLRKNNYLDSVKEVFSSDKELGIAVAFWGSDSIELFEKMQSSKIRLVCNLESGACNPKVIEYLLNHDSVDLRTHAWLHAKVLVNSDQAIIDSANISANGLSFEGSETEGWQEAGIVTTSQEIITETNEWFENIWLESVPITNEMLEKCVESWKKKRDNRLKLNKKQNSKQTLIRAAIERPEDFKDRKIFIVGYREDVSKEARETIEKEKAKIENAALREKIDYYDRWESIPDDAGIVDIFADPDGRLELEGFYTTPETPIVIPYVDADGDKGSIKICYRTDKIQGYKASVKSDSEIIRTYEDCIKQCEGYLHDEAFIIPLYEFAKEVQGYKEVSLILPLVGDLEMEYEQTESGDVWSYHEAVELRTLSPDNKTLRCTMRADDPDDDDREFEVVITQNNKRFSIRTDFYQSNSKGELETYDMKAAMEEDFITFMEWDDDGKLNIYASLKEPA